MNQPRIVGFDHLTLAKTVWGEARGESFEGQIAVAWVVKNRATRGGWYGESIASVCLKPLQFSCWNSNDPNRPQLDHVTEHTPGYLRALGVAALVITGDLADPTGGATNYATAALFDTGSVQWAKSMTETVRIGAHVFFKE